MHGGLFPGSGDMAGDYAILSSRFRHYSLDPQLALRAIRYANVRFGILPSSRHSRAGGNPVLSLISSFAVPPLVIPAKAGIQFFLYSFYDVELELPLLLRRSG
jgi:hypothetical protein